MSKQQNRPTTMSTMPCSIHILFLGLLASCALAQTPPLERVNPSPESPGAIPNPTWRDSVDPFDPTYRPPPRKAVATPFTPYIPKVIIPSTDRSVVMFDNETGKYDYIPHNGKPDRGIFQSDVPFAGMPEGSVPSPLPTNWGATLSPVIGNQLKEYPGRAMCRIVSRYVAHDGTDRYRVGTGTLVDAGLILTSGGMVYLHSNGDAPTQFMAESWILPGWLGLGDDRELTADDYTENFGWARGTAYGVASAFVSDPIDNTSVGFIRLSRTQSRSVGAITGWLGWRSEICGNPNLVYSNYGYPDAVCGGPTFDGTRLYTWTDSVDECPGFFNLEYFRFYTSTDCLRRFSMGMNGSSLFKTTQPYFIEGIIHDTLLTNDTAYASPLWEEFNDSLSTARTAHRGSTFDIEPLKYRTPEFLPVVRQGRTLMGGTVFISNTTNDDPNPRNITLRAYLSPDPTISNLDTLLGVFTYNSMNFAPMEVKEFTIPPMTIPYSAPTGIKYVGIIIDDSEDSNPSNNETNGWDTQRIDVDPCLPPSTPAIPLASDSTLCTMVRVSWTPSEFATGVNIYRSEGGVNQPGTLLGFDTESPYDDLTAVPGTTYRYWLTATNPCGESLPTLPNDGRRERSVLALSGVAASDADFCDRVRITWNATSNADFYQIYRGETAVFADATFQTSTTNVTYDDLTAATGIGYRYWVVGFNECGQGSAGFGDVGGTATPVGNPTNLIGGTRTTCAAFISWQPAPRATSYKVYRGTTNVFSNATQISTPTTTSFSDLTAPANSTRFYWIRATNACGDSGLVGPVSASGIGPLATPSNVNATDATTCTGSITITWNAVANAASYVIEQRNRFQPEPYAYYHVASVNAPTTSYTFNGPHTFNPGLFTVRAVDSCGGRGPQSAESSGTQGPITIPTNVQASPNTLCGAITITWDELPTDTGYELSRMTDGIFFRTVIAVDTSSPSIDVDVLPNTTYYYFVRAFSPCGESELSPAVSGQALPPIIFISQPQSALVPNGSPAQFSITQTGGDTYLWHLNGVPLGDNANLTGTQTPTLTINSVSPADAGFYTCQVSSACGTLVSQLALLTIDGFVCPADFNQDGGIDGGDIETFINAWEQGTPTADVNTDGGIDGSDIETFFGYWTAGGC